MSGLIERNTVDQVQQANNIVDVIGEYVSLTKKGKEMVGLCPFHEDRRPSMNVSETKQIFKCFSCGAGGDVIKFIQMQENISFVQAVQRLADRGGIQIPRSFADRPVGQKPPEGDPINLGRVNDWAARYYQANLKDDQLGRAVREYLSLRHMSSESISTWELGLALQAPQGLLQAATARNIERRLLVNAGLVTVSGQDRFVHRLMFPIRDASGRVTGFGGRTLGDDNAKYVNSPATVLFDKSNSLYGLYQARQAMVAQNIAIVVEGYTDCIMAHQAGVKNVVATLGTSFAEGHSRMLRRFAKTVVLLFDGDAAGAEAANRALDVCLKHGIDIRIASLPDGQDPADLVVSAGAQSFQDIIANAVDVLEFKWQRLSQRFEADKTLSGRRAALEDYIRTIAASVCAGNVSRIDRGLVVNRLSSVLGLGTQQIEAELQKHIGNVRRLAKRQDSQPKTVILDREEGAYAAVQQEILEVVLNAPQLYPRLCTEVTIDFFRSAELQPIAQVIFVALAENVKTTVAEMMARIEDIDIAQRMAGLVQMGYEKGNFETRYDAVMDTVRRMSVARISEVGGPAQQQTIHQFEHSLDSARRVNPHNLGLAE
ncbi:DNA primase [Planctomycetota bacterium]